MFRASLPLLVILISGCTPMKRGPQSAAHGDAVPVTPEFVVRQIEGGDYENVRAVWARLGVKANELFGTRETRDAPYSASIALREKESGLTVVTITDALHWDWQYLVFRRIGREWKLLGSVDLPWQKSFAPKCRWMACGDRGWLAIDQQTASATGYYELQSVWYDIEGGILREVLRYTATGTMASARPYEVDVESRVTDLAARDGRIVLTVSYEMDYRPGYVEIPKLKKLFQKQRTVCFCYRDGHFELDEAWSEMDGGELSDMWGSGGIEFARRNLPELLEMAEHGSAGQKEWLREWLKDSDEGPWTAPLLARLNIP